MKASLFAALGASAMLFASPAAPQEMLMIQGSVAVPLRGTDADRPRMCKVGPWSSVQLAYKPYGSPLFGSDGLTCSAVAPAAETQARFQPPRTNREPPSLAFARFVEPKP